MERQLLTIPEVYLIVIATLAGTLARIATLREGYRQYPSFPNGYLNQAVFGFVASILGAVAIPALMANNFTAVTFIALALTQFQNIRKMELNSLQLLEEIEFTKRGNAYIDGISKTFEARNYISLLVSIAMAVVMEILQHNSIVIRVLVGSFASLVVFFSLARFTKGRSIGFIADVRPGTISIKHDELYVDDIFVSNRIGIENGQEMICKEGLAVVLYPKAQHYRIALDNFGQRQAVLFEITRSLGVKRYHFTRKNYADGRIVFVIVPIRQDIEIMIKAARDTPILETIKKSHQFLEKFEGHHARS